MASSRELKNRIRSTKNLRQMTLAMEAVSAVKMRRSTALAVSVRPYALTALNILRDIQGNDQETKSKIATSPFFEERDTKRTCLVVITSDKGLAGAYNTNVLRAAQRVRENGNSVRVIAIGKKGRDYFARKQELVAEFVGAGDHGSLSDTEPIVRAVSDEFISKKSDEIVLVYTNFLSALKQEVATRTLLPFTEASLAEIVEGIRPLEGRYANIPAALEVMHEEKDRTYAFEPSPRAVLDTIVPELLKVQVFHAMLEANASEHSARMMAMKSASENADELVGDLTLQFNKARQAAITNELSEITAGKEALEVN